MAQYTLTTYNKLLIALLATGIALFLFILSVRFVASPWFIARELQQLPEDTYGLSYEERNQLALKGLYAVVPEGQGLVLLTSTQLQNKPAFTAKEIAHMADVRTLLNQIFTVGALFLLLFICFSIYALRNKKTLIAAYSLYYGSLLALCSLGIVGALVIFNFYWLFDSFHKLFFKKDTYLFDQTAMLIRLYPGIFWEDAALAVARFTAIESLLLLTLSSLWLSKLKK